MTYPLPFGTPLGRLVLEEIYDYFDGPRLFAARNDQGGLFLGYWADETQTGESWLYLPITRDRLMQVRSGGIPLARAFRAAEFGYAFRIDIDRESLAATTVAVAVAEIPDDWLPPANDRLARPTRTQPALVPSEVAQRAAKERRDMVGFGLRPWGFTRSEAPLLLLTQSLGSLQGLTEEVGFQIAPRSSGTQHFGLKDREKIERDTKLVAVGSFGGSFGILLGAQESADLFNHSLVGDCLRTITTLLQAGVDERLLHLRLRHLRARVSLRYRDLFQTLARLHSGLTFEWSSPRIGRRAKLVIELPEVRRIAEIVSRTTSETGPEFTRRARLISANTRSGGYELRGVPGWEKYIGHAEKPEGIADLRRASFDAVYDATLREITEANPLTGEVMTRHLLVRLARSGSQAVDA